MKRQLRRERRRMQSRDGFSVVETIVAVVLLSFALLGVTSVGTAVQAQMGRARSDLQLWAGLQTVADSLQDLGFGAVATDSRTIAGYSFSWTVDNASDPAITKVILRGSSTGRYTVADSMVIWLN